MDEGYIKFNSEWKRKEPLPYSTIQALNEWRQRLYQVSLVGAYPDGIGFGNVSRRLSQNKFIISGSKTGIYQTLDASHFSTVINFDIKKNWVECEGPIIASSESMSHAVIYQERPEVNAVFHVHDLALWKKWLYKIPTTAETATYGTPEMADEIIQLFKTTTVIKQKLFAMAGHEEGLFSFGKTLEEAGNVLLEFLEK